MLWVAEFVSDPTGKKPRFIPVRIEDINLEGLLPQVFYVDLVDKEEEEARSEIHNGVQMERFKPKSAPPFPGKILKKLNNEIKQLPDNGIIVVLKVRSIMMKAKIGEHAECIKKLDELFIQYSCYTRYIL